jgi:chromate transporter
MSEIDPPREKVSLFELAWTFNHIALASFGGGPSAWSREVLVVDLTAICTAIFIFSKTNPLIVVAAAGVLGYFGIV